ncbi:hypothetical protein M9H77_13809 [Catharanthus roseus]|uniref:Uncharacterized protein n=1 Tax=Catharanthus roseus TaxID=4058 RepID=A0ACC0BL86_CATRO|nr:hypothetical protein M9H77_13809 [Catharanthus roseus]
MGVKGGVDDSAHDGVESTIKAAAKLEEELVLSTFGYDETIARRTEGCGGKSGEDGNSKWGSRERVEQKTKEVTRHKGKHEKPKPWDDESIDHWKIEKFDPSWNESGMLEVSSFSIIFPQ